MASPDLAPALYAALIADSTIAAGLTTYSGAPAVFTNRPVPKDATYPLIVTADNVTHTDQDFIDDPLLVMVRDISFFGLVTQTRAVEGLARRGRDIFHRRRQSLSVAGWNVVDIVCRGPIVGRTDDDTTSHRLVTLTIRLSQ